MKKMALVVLGVFILCGFLGPLTTENLLFGEDFDFARVLGGGLGNGIGFFCAAAALLYGVNLVSRRKPS